MKTVESIALFLRENERFLVTSHSRPDGDSIGSQLALALALDQLGKSVEIVNVDPVPSVYRVLPGADRIRVLGAAAGAFDALVVLECGDLERSGVGNLEQYPAINIDHHLVNARYGVMNWVDPSAAAVAELLFELFVELRIEFDPQIATNLYTAIITDTGSFQFSNTTPKTLRIAAQLVDYGASPSEISRRVLLSQTEGRLRLLGKLLGTLEFDDSRRIAWVRLDSSMMRETGAERNDTEGFVNYPLNVHGIRVSALFREEADGYRISLRSNGEDDVSTVAGRFGGGGHRNAAACTLKGSFEFVRRTMVAELKTLFQD